MELIWVWSVNNNWMFLLTMWLLEKGAVGLFGGKSVLVFIIRQTGNIRTPCLKQR